MQIVNGKIVKVETLQIGVHVKSIVHIQGNGKEFGFVEFRGRNMMDLLKPFKENDHVNIIASLQGSISRAGVYFNNLVADSIQKV